MVPALLAWLALADPAGVELRGVEGRTRVPIPRLELDISGSGRQALVFRVTFTCNLLGAGPV